METISNDSLQPKDRGRIVKSSCSTKVLEMKSGEGKHFYSPTTNISRRYMPPHSKTMESNMSEEERVEGFVRQENQSQKSALGLTVRKGADSRKRNVDIVMPVKDAGNQVMASCRVPKG